MADEQLSRFHYQLMPSLPMTLRSWNQQTAFITGAAGGLGQALARRLISRGVTVAIVDLAADRVAAVTGELGPLARGFVVDVTDPASVAEAVRQLVAERGGIEILVNAAGITGQTNRKSHEVELADFDRVLALNLRGSFITSQAILPHMLRAGYGRVLHIASIAGKEGNAGMVAYSASKAAVIGMTKSQGKEYAETGITINAIAPAVIQTALTDAMPAEQVKYMTDRIPMRRCGSLQEFAIAAEFIVSTENSFTTGFCFDLSGGRATY